MFLPMNVCAAAGQAGVCMGPPNTARTSHGRCSGQPYVSMDEDGLVFAIAANGNIVSLFDARNFQHGPFLSFPMPTKQYGIQDLGVVTSMKFSCHQQHLMVCTANRIFLMDTFQGKEIVMWNQGSMDGSPPMEASFSADGRHVMSGACCCSYRRMHTCFGLLWILKVFN